MDGLWKRDKSSNSGESKTKKASAHDTTAQQQSSFHRLRYPIDLPQRTTSSGWNASFFWNLNHETKIDQLHVAIGIKSHVVWFQITKDETTFVEE
jgi:hypothetical protein